jgi:hypothetical protein
MFIDSLMLIDVFWCLLYSQFSMFTDDTDAFLMFVHIPCWLFMFTATDIDWCCLMFTDVFWCSLMFPAVYWCLFMFTDVDWWFLMFLMFTVVSCWLFMFIHVISCLTFLADQWLVMFILTFMLFDVHWCLLMFTDVYIVVHWSLLMLFSWTASSRFKTFHGTSSNSFRQDRKLKPRLESQRTPCPSSLWDQDIR